MQERMQELVDKLNDYARAYYAFDAPKVSDAEYDALFDALLALEAETGIVLPDSPTQRVGSEPLAAFEQQTHLAHCVGRARRTPARGVQRRKRGKAPTSTLCA